MFQEAMQARTQMKVLRIVDVEGRNPAGVLHHLDDAVLRFGDAAVLSRGVGIGSIFSLPTVAEKQEEREDEGKQRGAQRRPADGIAGAGKENDHGAGHGQEDEDGEKPVFQEIHIALVLFISR
jgi:hypothetical protein